MAPIKIAGFVRPIILQTTTPMTAAKAADKFEAVIFCIQNRQIKIDVIANDAIAVGMLISEPIKIPTTFESAQVKQLKIFTAVERLIPQSLV